MRRSRGERCLHLFGLTNLSPSSTARMATGSVSPVLYPNPLASLTSHSASSAEKRNQGGTLFLAWGECPIPAGLEAGATVGVEEVEQLLVE
jgi:hypothetical protein